MMTIYFGLYTFILALLWGLFIVAKIDAYKFKSFSRDIGRITKMLSVFLLIMSLLGYFVIYYGLSNDIVKVSNTPSIIETNY